MHTYTVAALDVAAPVSLGCLIEFTRGAPQDDRPDAGASREATGPEAPRPGYDRINGRSPGSRVAARHRLPGLPQWQRGTGSPLTVAGAAAALEPYVPHRIPCSLSRERPLIAAT